MSAFRLGLALLLLAPTGASALQAPAPAPSAEEAAWNLEALPAEAAQLEALLGEHEAALASEDALRIAASLSAMRPWSNEELIDPAKDALRYRASRLDKDAVDQEMEELGLRDKSDERRLIAEREAAVQAAAAALLGNFDARTASAALKRVVGNKDVRDDKPAYLAAAIESLGRVGYDRVEDDVLGEFRRFGDPAVMRACVRYIGALPTESYGTVRMLCEELRPPEPADPTAADNPPASYWEMRWQQWREYRMDVVWALQEITGQEFALAVNGQAGDTERALEYVREHKRELGLK